MICNSDGIYIPPAITPLIGLVTVISVGGTAEIVIPAGAYGGYIWNPLTSTDQGLVSPEYLYIDPITSAGLNGFGSTVALTPGQMFNIPIVKSTLPITVNAATSGHKFTAVYWMGP